MNRTSGFLRILLLTACLTTLVHSALAQPATGSRRWVDSARVLIDAGTAGGRPEGLEPAIALLDRVLTIVPGDPVLLHYKGYAFYRQSNLMTGRAKEDDVKLVLDEASKALEESAAKLAWPETYALQASVLGQMIGLSPGPITAMRLGPKSDQAMDRAVALAPTNPRVWLLRGIGSMFKPAFFGGGLDKAEQDIKKAIALFPNDKPAAPAPDWGYAEAWAWLGQVHAKQDRVGDARAAYKKALEIQPGFTWVTQMLLPELDRKKR